MVKLKELGKKFVEMADYYEVREQAVERAEKKVIENNITDEKEAFKCGFKEGLKGGSKWYVLATFMPITTTTITIARIHKHI